MLNKLGLLSSMSVLIALGGCFNKDEEKDQKLNKKQRKQVEKIVEKVILKKPEIIVKAMAKVLQSEEKKSINASKKKINDNMAAIKSTSDYMSFGKENADHTFVLFVDYNCVPCRTTLQGLHQFLNSDDATKDKAHFIIKHFPALGDKSETVSRGLHAAMMQGKYMNLHKKIIEEKAALSETDLLNLATSIEGLDVEKFRKDIESDEVKEKVKKSKELADKLDIKSTPTVLLNDVMFPGSISAAEYPKLIEILDKQKARKKEDD